MSESPEGPRRETIAASPDPLVDRGRKTSDGKSDSIDALTGVVFVGIVVAFGGVLFSAAISLGKINSTNVGSCDNEAKGVVNSKEALMNGLVFTVGWISVSRLPACTDLTLCTCFFSNGCRASNSLQTLFVGILVPAGSALYLRYTGGRMECVRGCGIFVSFQPRFSRQLYNNVPVPSSRDLLMLWFSEGRLLSPIVQFWPHG